MIELRSVPSTPDMPEDQLADYLQRLHDDFPFFVDELFKQHPDYWPIGEMERDACAFIADSSNRRRGVLAFRSAGKTHWGSAAYATWRLFRDANTKILIISKSKIPQARDITRLIKGWLQTVWFLRHMDPRDSTSELATDQTFQFDVAGADESKTPSVLAQGIEGHITGSRAHVVIADDIESGENTKTVAARQELFKKTDELYNIAKYGGKEVVYFGTYHHEESVYIKLANAGYAFRTYPFAFPTADEKFINLAPIIVRKQKSGEGVVGMPTFAHRYTRDDVIENESSGRTNWLMQYQLVANLASSNKYPIRLSDLIIYPILRDKAPISIAWGKTNDRGGSTALDMQVVGWEGDQLHAPIFVDPEWQAYTGTKAWIDPAGVGKDLTGLAIVGHLSGTLFVKGVYGLPGGGSSERMREICQLLKLHGARDCYVETNNDTYGNYFALMESTMREMRVEPGADPMYPNGWACSLEKRHNTYQKELRIIDSLEPVISSHRLVIHPDAIKADPVRKNTHELQWMLAAITKERNCLSEDGPIDALAGAVKEWNFGLRVDPARAAVATRTRAFDEALREHFRLTGRPTHEPRWQQTRSR